ncbi:MAG: DNA starvation/stationary phase protection protein [Cytophagales bacterium]|nr:DNA starvation/stationary phase protection protein [Cytophagales bacterium]
MKNAIGLDKDKAHELSNQLNELLANFQMYYQNLRGFHWNVTGQNFFELHAKFEELYNEAQESIDEIAERILTLENTPLHTFSDYEQVAEIPPARDVTDGYKCVLKVVENLSVLLAKEREILDMADETGDEGTNSLMSDYIAAQEKVTWMLSAYLK